MRTSPRGRRRPRAPLTARRRLVVKNLPDLGYLPKPADPDPEPRAVYIGDVRRSRGLAAMLAAVGAAERRQRWTSSGRSPPPDQAGSPGGGAESPAAARVRLHGRLAPREAWGIARGAWTGLALLDDTRVPRSRTHKAVRIPGLRTGCCGHAAAPDG
ncbi:hypothetical protein ACU686_07235 [Yinghuangia aomiensis]